MQITMNGETNADGYLILKIPMKLKNTAFKLTITAQEAPTPQTYLTQTSLLDLAGQIDYEDDYDYKSLRMR